MEFKIYFQEENSGYAFIINCDTEYKTLKAISHQVQESTGIEWRNQAFYFKGIRKFTISCTESSQINQYIIKNSSEKQKIQIEYFIDLSNYYYPCFPDDILWLEYNNYTTIYDAIHNYSVHQIDSHKQEIFKQEIVIKSNEEILSLENYINYTDDIFYLRIIPKSCIKESIIIRLPDDKNVEFSVSKELTIKGLTTLVALYLKHKRKNYIITTPYSILNDNDTLVDAKVLEDRFVIASILPRGGY